MNYVDIIKSRLLLSEIVSKKVKLIKRGDNFLGLCPFHNEKTPSFSVTNAKGLYYCFGCSAHGDVFEFVSQTEGLSFKDTIKKLAQLAGVELPKNPEMSKKDNKLFLALEFAADWFFQKNQEVVNYLKQRGISPNTINKFKIGYAPSFGLKEHLNSLGIEDQVLFQVGLINKNFRDYFYDRLMFPILSFTGKIIAFGGRALNAQQQPKYLNSPENQLFKKKENLYGINFALSEIRKKQHAFIVEGYFDVIAFHQAGIVNTVAPLGTAISVEQIKNLWKFTKEIFVCMDGDNAGCSAANRIATLVLPILEPGYTLKFITLPNNRDPSDICNDLKYDKENIFATLNYSTKLHSEYLWHQIADSDLQSYNTPEKYSVLEHKFMEYVNCINNISIKRYYRDYFYTKISELRRNSKKNSSFNSKNKAAKGEYFYNKSPELIKAEQNQALILRIVVEFTEMLSHPIFFEQFSNFEFSDINMQKLQQYIVDIISKKIEINKETLLEELEKFNTDEVMQYIFEKTKVLNSQLNEKKSAEIVWSNILLLKELYALENERVRARLNKNFDLEERLIMQVKRIEKSLKEMQMEFIHKEN